MTLNQWAAVDRYITDLLVSQDSVLEDALRSAADAGLPAIHVAPNQGKLLGILAQSISARTILEVGTLGGYSTIWMARALPANGKIITLEYEPKHADIARANFVKAGLSDMIEVRVGAALDTLPQIAAEGHGPFDLVFIDADKDNTASYFEWALKMTRPGSMIIVDNVVRDGAVVNPGSEDSRVQGIRRFMDALAAEPRVTATAVQTVGSKGYDGLAIALVV